MKGFMDWEDCKKEYVREVKIDKDKIESIISVANKRKEFINKIEVNNENCSFIIEAYYEIIKELLVALLLKKGLKSDNHQCLISYFYKNNPKYEYESNLILQLSFLRNRLNYYGEKIDIGFYEKNKLEFEHIIEILKGLLK